MTSETSYSISGIIYGHLEPSHHRLTRPENIHPKKKQMSHSVMNKRCSYRRDEDHIPSRSLGSVDVGLSDYILPRKNERSTTPLASAVSHPVSHGRKSYSAGCYI